MKIFGKSLQENRTDWKAHNDKVLERIIQVINNNIPTTVTLPLRGRISQSPL